MRKFEHLARRVTVPLVVLLLCAGTAIAASMTTGGRIGPQLGITPSGRRLRPAGRMTTLGDFPSGGALTPDGRFYWAIDSGHGYDDVQIVDVGSGKVAQVLPLPGAYGSVAFAPDGRTAYVSGEPVGTDTPDHRPGMKATQGDAIHVFDVDPTDGTATEGDPIMLPATSGGTAQKEDGNPLSVAFQPPGPGASSGLGWPIGLAVTADGQSLVIALNQADQVAIIDLGPAHATKLVKVGTYPYAVALSGDKAYVSNEYDGTVSVVDIAAATVTRTVTVGPTNSHPEGLATDPTMHRAYVAMTNQDSVVELDTHTGDVIGHVSVGRSSGVGTAPNALAVTPDHRTLYVADAGEDAVAVVALTDRADGVKALSVVGRVPTASYPTAVAVTPDGHRLLWVAAKGLGAGPNPLYGQNFAASGAAPYGQYVLDMLLGRLGVLDTPSDGDAARMQRDVDAEVIPTDFSAAPVDTPVQGPAAGPSAQIKHVFYVVKENRTYDQIFGSDPRGDGDPSLELFDGNAASGPAAGVTPNAHDLTQVFPLLDHVYADSEVSVDGHLITSGSYAIDFVQKALQANYANRGRVLEAGQAPETFPPNHFLFDQAAQQGVSFVNDGELSAGVLPAGNDGRSTYDQVVQHTAWGYPLFFGCDNAGLIPVTADDHDVACSTDSGTMGPDGAAGVGHSRFDFFQQQFNDEIASGTVPALTYLTLPNDHTNGVVANHPTPRAMVADNDLGLGQLVDLISHSSIWSSSAIFVVEDDGQDGADHVDAHRMPAYVISPWAKHHAVVSTRYDQLSVLRTIELMLGLRPLSLYDGLAEPMYDAFVSGPSLAADPTPYTAELPKQSLDETNTKTADGLDGALPFGTRDLVPQELFDAALWHSVYGSDSTPPPPGPNASAAEAARAREALEVWRDGGDVAAWLKAHPAGDDGVQQHRQRRPR